MKTIILLLVFAAAGLVSGLPHMISNMNTAVVAGNVYGKDKGRTESFDGFVPGSDVASLPGWTVHLGVFITMAGGQMTSNASAGVASWSPAGFTLAANHEAEVLLRMGAVTAESWHGPTVAVQPTGSCYFAAAESTGYIYFGVYNAGGAIDPFLYVRPTTAAMDGMKLRLTVTGTGTARRVSCSYTWSGEVGWITPPGWDSWDPTVYFDGGKAGVIGIRTYQTVTIDSLTIRNK